MRDYAGEGTLRAVADIVEFPSRHKNLKIPENLSGKTKYAIVMSEKDIRKSKVYLADDPVESNSCSWKNREIRGYPKRIVLEKLLPWQQER